MIHHKLNKYFQSSLTLTPREVMLGACACVCGTAACLMTGMVVGMLISPRKNVTIGSHNGSGNEVTRLSQEEEESECVPF